MEKQLNLITTPSPHLHSKDSVSNAMRDVLIALLPVTLISILIYQLYAVFLIAVCLGMAAFTEIIFRKILRRKATLHDLSAMVTGLLVALCFAPGTPWWTAALAVFIGIGLAKELMGGLGWNRFNPALFGRLAVILVVPLFAYVTGMFAPLRQYFGTIDTMTQATPLALIIQGEGYPGLLQLLTFSPGGSLSETSPLALILGGVYLIYKKHISWHTPLAIIAAVAALGLFDMGKLGIEAPLLHLFAGGVMLGAFFMATDWVTSPITPSGKIVFGVAIGVLLMVFRIWLAPTEGMAFSILIMNAFVPMIDRYTKRSKFGEVKEHGAGASVGQPVTGKSS